MTEAATYPVGEERERLVAELNLCQALVDNSSERTWESGGIILAGAMATLALMLQINASQLAAAVITSVFAVGAILVLFIWRDVIIRQKSLQREATGRMRELEDALGMEIQRRIVENDAEFQRQFNWYGKIGTTSMLVLMARFVTVGWVVVVAWRWAIYAGLLD